MAASQSAPPRVLVVGAGPFQLDILRTARRMGIETVAVDRAADAPGMREAAHAVVTDIIDEAAVLEVARRFAVQGVCTAASDVAVGAVSSVVDALGLTGLRSEVTQRCRDKLQTFQVVDAAKLHVPRTLPACSLDEARRAVGELGGYPVVVKPRSAAGGRGVAVVGSESELAASIERARHYDRYGQGALVQTFVRGAAHGAEAFFWRGELLAAFILDDQFEGDFVSPIGHSLPTSLDEAMQQKVREAVQAFGHALGLSDGPANFDLRIADNRVVLIEVNARLGGNSITDLIRACHGIDLSAATLRAALGQPPLEELRVRRSLPSASRLFIAEGHGILRVQAPFCAFRADANVLTAELFGSDGVPATMVVDERTILGRCLTHGRTATEAVALCEAIAANVMARVRLDPR